MELPELRFSHSSAAARPAIMSPTGSPSILLLCLLVTSGFARKDRQFVGRVAPLRIRIHENVRKGAVLYRISERLFAHDRPLGYSLRGPDRSRMRVVGRYLKATEDLTRRLGETYNVTLIFKEIKRKEKIGAIPILLVVSKRNKHVPRFRQDAFHAEVYRDEQVNKMLLQLRADDPDEQPYNARVVFSFAPPPNAFFRIDPARGVVLVSAGLLDAPAVTQLRAVASNPDGAPVLSATAAVTVIIRVVPAPSSLRISVLSPKSAEACWTVPSSLRVRQFKVTWAESNGREQVQSRTTHGGGGDCVRMEALRSRSEYWVEVRGQQDGKTGVPLRQWFWLPESMCDLEATCDRVQRCVTLPEPLWFRCECGKNDLPCLSKFFGDCENGGTMLVGGVCSCPANFSGDRCQELTSCVSGQSACSNDGECRLVAGHVTCHCRSGFTGKLCDKTFPCLPNPCQNGGSCTNATDPYDCDCVFGFYGKNCERYHPCSSLPCLNEGRCRNLTDQSFDCICSPGFFGKLCEEYSPCNNDPCLNSGLCNSEDGKVRCRCMSGYFGDRCQHKNLCLLMAEPPCSSSTSLSCLNTSDSTYECTCQHGYFGVDCRTYDPCPTKPCLHEGSCVHQTGARNFTCRCQEPYFGEICQLTNPCYEMPCADGATCYNVSGGGYECRCPPGFFGARCDRFDACTSSPCLNGGTCHNTSAASFWCSCPKSWAGNRCHMLDSCTPNACQTGYCVVLPEGKYECRCPDGLGGTRCDVRDPCASKPCLFGGSCVPHDNGRYECICRNGFYGALCALHDVCFGLNCGDGHCESFSDGSRYCVCPPGQFGQECSSDQPCAGTPCADGSTCVAVLDVSPHKFRCLCDSYSQGDRCQEKNPCASNPCDNQGACHRTSNTHYNCTCRGGFQGHRCEEQSPCYNSTDLSYNQCSKNSHCRRDGSEWRCDCFDGYIGRLCKTFDPCRSSKPCYNDGVCLRHDTTGFQCHCPPGFFGPRCQYHTTCRHYECFNDARCVRTHRGDECRCTQNFTGKFCHLDVDECASSRCEHGASCLNTIGSFHCVCDDGFVGPLCERIARCFASITNERGLEFVWPVTTHGHVASLQCPGKVTSITAKRRCSFHEGKAIWQDVDASECQGGMSTSEALELLSPLSTLACIDSAALRSAAETLERVVDVAIDEPSVAERMLSVVDRLIDDTCRRVLDVSLSERVLNSLDRFQREVRLREDSFSLAFRNLELQLEARLNRSSKPRVFRSVLAEPSSISVPTEVLQKYPSVDRLYFAHFRNSFLFRSDRNFHDLGDVIAAGIPGKDVNGLNNCVYYTIQNPSVTQRQCVYWDRSVRRWSTDGMVTVSDLGVNITCCSNHLTYFAVISMEALKKSFLIVVIASISTAVGCLLLLVVLITFSSFRSLNQDRLSQLILQLCCSLLLLFVSNLASEHTDHRGACTVVAILHHYLCLSALLWALLTVQHFSSRLRQTGCPQRNFACFVSRNVFLGWILPLTVIAFPLYFSPGVYDSTGSRCILRTDFALFYYASYVVPCGVLVLCNIALVLLLAKRSSRPPIAKTNTFSKSQKMGTCTVDLSIVALWVVDVVSEAAPFRQHVCAARLVHVSVTFLVSLTIFVTYVALRWEARTAWLSFCRGDLRRRRVATKPNPMPTRAADADYQLVAPPSNYVAQRFVTAPIDEDKVIELRDRTVTWHDEVISSSPLRQENLKRQSPTKYLGRHRSCNDTRHSIDWSTNV